MLDKAEILRQEEEYPRAFLVQDILELVMALRRSDRAVGDWLVTYASDFCNPIDVQEAGNRIVDAGGTIAYIAKVQEHTQKVLKRVLDYEI